MSDKETKGMRAAIIRDTKSNIAAGYTREQAKKIATDCAIRHDRRQENKK